MNRFEKVEMNKDDVMKVLSLNTDTEKTLVYLDRYPTAGESVSFFMGWISYCLKFSSVKEQCGGAFMAGVGLRAGGRSSCFDMVYDIENRMLYAIDSKDSNYVCRVPVAVNE